MIDNYVIFDTNGLLSDSALYSISKGNHNVDLFHVAFTEYDYNNTYLTVAVTLPDGNALPQLATSISDFNFKNTAYKGYKLAITEPITSQAGTVTMTFILKSKEDDSRLCTSQLNVTIYDSDVAGEPTITEAQLENLLTTIDNGDKELENKKLDKDFSLYPNATVNGNELIAVYNDETKTNSSIPVSATYNITSVNGVEPLDKTISLNAYDIPYDTRTTGEVLESTIAELNNKVSLDEAVTYRSGVTIEPEIEVTPYKGLIPYTYIKNDPNLERNVAEILSNGYEFKKGDLISFDLTLSESQSSGTLNVNKVLLEFGSNDTYRVPLFSSYLGQGNAGMTLDQCAYEIKMLKNKIVVTGSYFRIQSDMITYTPTVTLNNISILRV